MARGCKVFLWREDGHLIRSHMGPHKDTLTNITQTQRPIYNTTHIHKQTQAEINIDIQKFIYIKAMKL